MDKIKPYLFWIICGVLLLIEIGLMLTLEPVNSKKKTAMQAARALNAQMQSLSSGYGAKADNQPPKEFEIDDGSYFNTLKAQYLVTAKWQQPLEKVKTELEAHKENVEQNLQNRSKVLHRPVKENASRADWYFTYEAVTASYLKELYSKELLALSSDPLLKAKDDTEKEDVRKADRRLRETLGFYTKGQDFPDINEQENIALRLRISEAIIHAVQGAEGVLLSNNLINTEKEEFVLPPEGVVKAQIRKINWGMSAQRWDEIKSVQVKGGRALPFKVVLNGSASALLAVTAKIEEYGAPIFVVHGCVWKQPRKAGRRKEAVKKVDQVIELTLSIAVLDYQEAQ